MEIDYRLTEVYTAAEKFWKMTGSHRVIAFHGPVGAGKTTFIHALCHVKNVKDLVTSPTFSIINEYVYPENGYEKKIFHIDLYRLQNEDEAVKAGAEDCLLGDHTCLVEWPEKAPGIFPDDTLHVYMETLNNETRKLRICNK